MLLSYIIPVYNAEKFLNKCVHSILDQPQDKDNFEIILVNDGSKDSSHEICIELEQRYPQIRYFKKSNAGPGHTRNYGLEKAGGKYIWFIDADDYLEEGVVGRMLPELGEQLDVYIFGYRALDLEGNETRRSIIKTENLKVDALLNKGHYINMVWCKLIKKSVLDTHQIRFREDIRGPEDFHLSFRLLSVVNQIQTLNLIAYNYIENPASLMNTRSDEHMQKLADDSITAVNDLRPLVAAMDPDRQVAFGAWLANFVYGLLLSFVRFKYSKIYVSRALDQLAAKQNYPLTLGSSNWKRRIFTSMSNIRPVFLSIIALKRMIGK
jgi:glycosyltransferase involved in cell wall biosynthesis